MNIAFIPVRIGSKTIPKKNIKDLCGKPLIYWVLKSLEDSEYIDKVFLAIDSEIFSGIVKNFNFNKVELYWRDPENAKDKSSTESVMLEFLEKKFFKDNDLFILVQATNPFTTSFDFDEAIKLYKQSNSDSLLSCVRTKRFFWDKNGSPINYNYIERPLRQYFEGFFMENGAFYINTVSNIKRDKNRLSGKIIIYEMPEYTGFEIDELSDWIICEQLMKKYITNDNKNIKKIKLMLIDVDGVLTDAGMYYSENGDELKKFNTLDGKAIEMIKNLGIKVGIITSEDTRIVENRSKKLNIDYLFQGVKNKLDVAKRICQKENITFKEIAYIGDDVNDYELLNAVGVPACPSNAVDKIKSISNIIQLSKNGGEGVVREFVELLIKNLEQVKK